MFVFENNVLTTIDSIFLTTDLSLYVRKNAGIYNSPPYVGSGDQGVITLVDNIETPTKIEIIYYSVLTGGGALPIKLSGLLRGREGTTIHDWAVGDTAYQALTAELIGDASSVTVTVDSDAINLDGGRSDSVYSVDGLDGGGA